MRIITHFNTYLMFHPSVAVLTRATTIMTYISIMTRTRVERNEKR
jgi:hypothetical protein